MNSPLTAPQAFGLSPQNKHHNPQAFGLSPFTR